MDTHTHLADASPDRRIRRRGLLGGLLGAGAAGLVLPARAVASRPAQQVSVTIDVACLVHTMRLIPAPETTPTVPPSPLYGSPFLVEGRVYAAAALEDRDGFDPDGGDAPSAEETLGTWLCRGWLLSRDGRPDPHAATSQLHTFAALSDEPFPAHQLASEGLEGADEGGWTSTRIVVGGTGDFAGARGTVDQTHIGENATSLVMPGGVIMNGPNFRFSFHLTTEDTGRDVGGHGPAAAHR